MISFENCDVIINGSGILAQSASIDSSNSLIPVYTVGRKGIINQSPNGPITNKFSFSYIPEISNEPSYNQAIFLKNMLNDLLYSGIRLNIGGIEGDNCYLENYSLKVSTNNITQANAGYVNYIPLNGGLSLQQSQIVYNSMGTLGHGWSTFILSTGDFSILPSYELDYSLSLKWEPIYTIGQKYPVQVKLLEGEEKITIMRDVFYSVDFSGNDACNQLFHCSSDSQEINVYGLSINCALPSITGNPVIIPIPSGGNIFTGIIVDNPNAIFSGIWIISSTSQDQRYGDNFAYGKIITGKADSTVIYTPNISTSGYYNIYTNYTDGLSRTTGANISINYSGGVYNTIVNQSVGGGVWNLIGSGLPFATGIGGYVTVFNSGQDTGRIVIADAFMWTTGNFNKSGASIITGDYNNNQSDSITKSFPSCKSLQFSVSGMKIRNEQVQAKVGDIVRTITTLYKNF